MFEVDNLLPLVNAASMLKMISLEAVVGKITQESKMFNKFFLNLLQTNLSKKKAFTQLEIAIG